MIAGYSKAITIAGRKDALLEARISLNKAQERVTSIICWEPGRAWSTKSLTEWRRDAVYWEQTVAHYEREIELLEAVPGDWISHNDVERISQLLK